MKAEKAIELLEKENLYHPRTTDPDLFDARSLGIAALSFYAKFKLEVAPKQIVCLLGEDDA